MSSKQSALYKKNEENMDPTSHLITKQAPPAEQPSWIKYAFFTAVQIIPPVTVFALDVQFLRDYVHGSTPDAHCCLSSDDQMRRLIVTIIGLGTMTILFAGNSISHIRSSLKDTGSLIPKKFENSRVARFLNSIQWYKPDNFDTPRTLGTVLAFTAGVFSTASTVVLSQNRCYCSYCKC